MNNDLCKNVRKSIKLIEEIDRLHSKCWDLANGDEKDKLTEIYQTLDELQALYEQFLKRVN